MEEIVLKGIVAATIFIFVAIFIIILVTYKFYWSKVEQNILHVHSILKSQEDERRRIAIDIHDSLGGILSVIKIKIDLLMNLSFENQDFYKDNLKESHSLLLLAIQEARNASNALTPEAIKNFGLKGAINDLVRDYSKFFEVDLINGLSDISNKNVQINIYRMLQELFNNSMKYSRATKIQLEVVQNSSLIKIKYSDNGVGFNFNHARKISKGSGLSNLKYRVDFLLGKMHFENKNGSTFFFHFDLNKCLIYEN